MDAEIIGVGSELLLGQIAQYRCPVYITKTLPTRH